MSRVTAEWLKDGVPSPQQAIQLAVTNLDNPFIC